MVVETCSFETDRLLVGEWHSFEAPAGPVGSLARFVAEVMTEPVTKSLPDAWQGAFTVERATAWIAERDADGTTLMILDRATNQGVGLMILFENPADDPSTGSDLRIGYFLAESAWGKGFASELLAGFVGWCRRLGEVASLTGGVERDNVASIRVLEKNGFERVADADSATDELQYRLVLAR